MPPHAVYKWQTSPGAICRSSLPRSHQVSANQPSTKGRQLHYLQQSWRHRVLPEGVWDQALRRVTGSPAGWDHSPCNPKQMQFPRGDEWFSPSLSAEKSKAAAGEVTSLWPQGKVLARMAMKLQQHCTGILENHFFLGRVKDRSDLYIYSWFVPVWHWYI